MNEAHLEFCASPEWRTMVETMVLPAAIGDADLGDDVIEVGPGPGFTTDVLRTRAAQLTAVEIDPSLAAALEERLAGENVRVICGDATALDLESDRFTGATSFNMLHHVPTRVAQDQLFSEVARVLRSGGLFIAADSVGSEELRLFHEGDTYNPIDPETLAAWLATAGFEAIDVHLYDLGWTCTARAI